MEQEIKGYQEKIDEQQDRINSLEESLFKEEQRSQGLFEDVGILQEAIDDIKERLKQF